MLQCLCQETKQFWAFQYFPHVRQCTSAYVDTVWWDAEYVFDVFVVLSLRTRWVSVSHVFLLIQIGSNDLVTHFKCGDIASWTMFGHVVWMSRDAKSLARTQESAEAHNVRLHRIGIPRKDETKGERKHVLKANQVGKYHCSESLAWTSWKKSKHGEREPARLKVVKNCVASSELSFGTLETENRDSTGQPTQLLEILGSKPNPNLPRYAKVHVGHEGQCLLPPTLQSSNCCTVGICISQTRYPHFWKYLRKDATWCNHHRTTFCCQYTTQYLMNWLGLLRIEWITSKHLNGCLPFAALLACCNDRTSDQHVPTLSCPFIPLWYIVVCGKGSARWYHDDILSAWHWLLQT